NNFWGSANGPNTAANTYKSPVPGSSGVSSNVTFVAWLHDNTDSDNVTPGFQHANADTTTPALSTGDQTVAEGDASSTINLGSFTDSFSATGLWHVTIDFGDGSPIFSEYVNSDGPIGNVSHTYVEETAIPLVATIQVTDGSGNKDTKTLNVTVTDP